MIYREGLTVIVVGNTLSDPSQGCLRFHSALLPANTKASSEFEPGSPNPFITITVILQKIDYARIIS